MELNSTTRLTLAVAGGMTAALAIAGCSNSGVSESPDHCPRGKVIGTAGTLAELKAEALQQEFSHGVVHLQLGETDGGVRVFEADDKKGHRLYYLNVWQADSGDWVYSHLVTCA